MKRTYIVSERKYQKWPSFDTVFEWEDEMAEYLEVPILFESGGLLGKGIRFFRRFLINHTNLYSFFILPTLITIT